jgi:hypothetical protein
MRFTNINVFLEKLKTMDHESFVKFVTGFTSLHFACQNNDLDDVKMLLEKGADPNAVCKKGYTPIFYIENCEGFYLEIIIELISYGADIHIKNNDGISFYDEFLELSERLETCNETSYLKDSVNDVKEYLDSIIISNIKPAKK